MKAPKLPGALVAGLGTLAGILAIVGPGLDSPWREVAGAVVAVGSWLGASAAQRAVRAHADAVRALGRAEGGQ